MLGDDDLPDVPDDDGPLEDRDCPAGSKKEITSEINSSVVLNGPLSSVFA